MAASRFVLILFTLLSTHMSATFVHADESAQISSQTSPIRPLSFQVLASGNRSGCLRPAKMLISTAAEWRRVWKIHDAKAEVPEIDFARQSVIALLSGENGRGLQVEQVVQTPTEIVVYFRQKLDTAKGTQPFQFVTVTKPQAPLRFVLSNPDDCEVCVVR